LCDERGRIDLRIGKERPGTRLASWVSKEFLRPRKKRGGVIEGGRMRSSV